MLKAFNASPHSVARFRVPREPRRSADRVRIREPRDERRRSPPTFDSIKPVHLIAISGVAMTLLAGMLVRHGLQVTGSDQNVYPPASWIRTWQTRRRD